jgi:prepilin-type N-terminal cleavage/methylation domain-containing protein
MRHERGFTLIEVLVALAIGALVVLLAHQVFAAFAQDGRALIAARAQLDRTINGRRWLAATFLSLEVGRDSAEGFDGRADHIDFTAWEQTPDGWFERRNIVLGWEGDRLEASVNPGAAVELMDSVSDVAFEYLLEPGLEARWVREWVSPVSAPVAVRMRIAKAGCGMRDAGCVVDTLLFLIKERG